MILVGTSGWSYDDWYNNFYPPHLPKSKFLRYYTAYFETTEINSTYYRIPDIEMMKKLIRHTPEYFRFTAKLYQGFTHKPLKEVNKDEIREYKEAMKPLLDTGKLEVLLAQFPMRFKNTKENREHILFLKEQFQEYVLAVEFRHISWIEEDVKKFLEENGLVYVCVDEPAIPELVPPIHWATHKKYAYVRFHSRDAEKWWQGEKERYNYYYKEEELEEWVKKVRELAQLTETVYVFFNNCHNGYAAKNALQFKQMLGLPKFPLGNNNQQELNLL